MPPREFKPIPRQDPLPPTATPEETRAIQTAELREGRRQAIFVQLEHAKELAGEFPEFAPVWAAVDKVSI